MSIITTHKAGETFVCDCGNTPDSDGFFPVAVGSRLNDASSLVAGEEPVAVGGVTADADECLACLVCVDDAHTYPVIGLPIWICRRLCPALAPLPARPVDAYLLEGKPSSPVTDSRRQQQLPFAVALSFTHDDKAGPLRAGEFASTKRCRLPVDGYKNLGVIGNRSHS